MKRTFYIFSSGELSRQGNTVCFRSLEGERKFLPVEDISEILVFGELDLNKRLLEFLSQKEVLLHFFGFESHYVGSFYPKEHLDSGCMTLKQAEFYLDAAKRLDIACRFVWGAARNILRVLKYYEGREKNVKTQIDSIEALLPLIEGAPDTEVLMAIEGNIRDIYYRAFDEILGLPEFTFDSRSRRPPRNELNALLSFGNSILYSVCLKEIYQTHLDPRIGYLHTTNFRRFSLNLDIAEIFKPIIVDRVIFTVLGKQMIKANDFEKGTGGIMMKEATRKLFVRQLEEKLRTTIEHRSIGRPVSYERLIRLDLYKLEKHLLGEKLYEPFIATW